MVPGCTNGWRKTKGQGISYHRLPQGEIRKVWLQRIRRENPRDARSSFVCSVHFTTGCFVEEIVQRTLNPKRRLKSDAVPTVFLHSPKDSAVVVSNNRRKQRRRRRETKQVRCLHSCNYTPKLYVK